MHPVDRPWSYIAPIAITLAAVGVSTTAYAGVAHADVAGYITLLRDKYPFVSVQRLVSEGHLICTSIDGGQRGVDTIEMVVRDLGMSEAQAIETITAAMTQLGC